ncbi:MAG: DUF3489 domain-containing protein [Alphaproteobacteria bacterium]|nr:DUF3489 domain-containing protein [Alphaproteobacteria bacterium]
MSLSPAALIVMTRAAERPDHRLQFHRKLPTGGRHKMIDALLRDGLIAETVGDYRLGDASTLIEDTATGLMLTTLALTDAGFRAIGQEPPCAEPAATVAPTVPSAEAVAQEAAAIADALDAATVAPTPRTNLRAAAAAVLAAWDDQDNRDTDIIAALEVPMEALRTLLAGTAPRAIAAPRKPREGTKQEAVLALLRRAEGATVVQIAEATNWAYHTVRGFLAGLKKKGIKVETLEKVRMVGPNKEGAKGSYTVYRAG